MKALLAALLFFVIGCGSNNTTEYKKVPSKKKPVEKPDPVDGPKFADVLPLIEQHCQGCHAAAPRISMVNEEAFLGSGCGRIENNSMPPQPNVLPDDVKEKFDAICQ